MPIRTSIDPMERLLVATFVGDPEFEAIEPQAFNDPVNGTGLRVLRYRKNGKIDVYYQRGVSVDRSTFTLGAGIGDFEETTIEPARFDIGERAVDVDIGFYDVEARRVELRIHEDIRGKRGFPLLAPIGADIREPKQLFLVFMPKIDLVRRTGSTVNARIGSRPQHFASLPILLGGQRVWFIRYAANPIIGNLNPPSRRPVLFEAASPGEVAAEGMRINVDRDFRATQISTGDAPDSCELDFDPGFPNMISLPDGASVRGRWTIRLGGVAITGGAYGASRSAHSVGVSLDVTDSWKPCGLPLSLNIFTGIMRRFRTWPTTYRWRGTLTDGELLTLSGNWARTGVRRDT